MQSAGQREEQLPMVNLPITHTQMTYTEYLQLPESLERMELIEGELIVPPAPSDDHQSLVTYLAACLIALIPEGTWRVAPTDVILTLNTVVQPDLFWIAPDSSRCTLKDKKWHGAPDLVVEILSPSTALYDKREKYALYEKHGVREYWLIDPAAHLVEVYVLDKTHFQRAGVYARTDTFQSPTLFQREVELVRVFR
jgi:Uma2 family endonuclease